MLGSTIYNPGDSVNIAGIGSQPTNNADAGTTLVCVTTNVNTECCRDADNPNGGSVGGWVDPNGMTIPRPGEVSGQSNVFTQYLYLQQVRLASVGSPTGPMGTYTCVVPDSGGTEVTANIIIISSPGRSYFGNNNKQDECTVLQCICV